MANTKFSFRAFTSLILFWMFVTLLVSGVVLFIAPPGRIAHWSEWRLLALTKGQWQGVHTLSSLAFFVGGLFHLLKFNRHVIWTYVKRSRQAVAPFRGVVAASTLLWVFVIIGTGAGWPPFSLVMDLGESATQSWASTEPSPPSPHAEDLPLGTVVESLGLNRASARSVLAESGVEIAGFEHKLLEVADANDLTPAELYSLLRAAAPDTGLAPRRSAYQPAGLGRRTIAEVAAKQGIGVDDAIERLNEAGVDAGAEEKLRTVADRAGTTPAEVFSLLSRGSSIDQPGGAGTKEGH